MAKRVLVDSSVFIGSMREGRDPFQLLANYAPELLFVTCGMVRMEVLRGVRQPAVDKVTRAFDVLVNIATDHAIWLGATGIAWHLDRRGKTIPATDILVACCAISADAAVLTFDHHFQVIPGLRVCESLAALEKI